VDSPFTYWFGVLHSPQHPVYKAEILKGWSSSVCSKISYEQLLKQGSKIETLMDKWCNAMKLVLPQLFFGHQLPNAYGIEDLQYFLLE